MAATRLYAVSSAQSAVDNPDKASQWNAAFTQQQGTKKTLPAEAGVPLVVVRN
jgi:hypothetical protein